MVSRHLVMAVFMGSPKLRWRKAPHSIPQREEARAR